MAQSHLSSAIFAELDTCFKHKTGWAHRRFATMLNASNRERFLLVRALESHEKAQLKDALVRLARRNIIRYNPDSLRVKKAYLAEAIVSCIEKRVLAAPTQPTSVLASVQGVPQHRAPPCPPALALAANGCVHRSTHTQCKVVPCSESAIREFEMAYAPFDKVLSLVRLYASIGTPFDASFTFPQHLFVKGTNQVTEGLSLVFYVVDYDRKADKIDHGRFVSLFRVNGMQLECTGKQCIPVPTRVRGAVLHPPVWRLPKSYVGRPPQIEGHVKILGTFTRNDPPFVYIGVVRERYHSNKSIIEYYRPKFRPATPIRSSRNEGDDDLVCEEEYVSLKCSVGHVRIKDPVRGWGCTHRQCVDLNAYLNVVRQSHVWACPICYKSMPLQSIKYDAIFAKYLESAGEYPDATRAKIIDGGNSVMIECQDNAELLDSGDNDDVIALISSDDESVSAVPAERNTQYKSESPDYFGGVEFDEWCVADEPWGLP